MKNPFRKLDNDRLSHWFVGAALSWLLFFVLVGLLVFHLGLKVPIAPIAAFNGIFCAVQLLVTPWLFSARATPQNPRGNRARITAVVYVWLTVGILLFLYYIRRTWIEDIETRDFTTIAMLMMVPIGILGFIRYRVVLRRQNVMGELQTKK